MKTPTWIWYFGDFAIRQRLLCDTRRLEQNYYRPAPWHLDDCYHNVIFRKQVELEKPEEITVWVDGIGSAILDNGYRQLGKPFLVPAGQHLLIVEAANLTGLPAIFVEGETIVSDESWLVSHDNLHYEPAERWNFDSRQCPPSAFSFPTEKLNLAVLEADGKTIYDAGQETFARLAIHCQGTGKIRVYLGESLPEVLSDTPCIWFEADAEAVVKRTALAMRYLRVEAEDGVAVTDVEAWYEKPERTERGAFACSDALLNRIMEVSVHTLALNCRELIFDGIKRDRYCWSGDAYQSYLLNYYLFFDQDLCRRTMQALRGRDGMTRHWA